MSLTREQKKDLDELSEYFRKVKKLAKASSIDLDVYMTEYRENGFQVYASEKVTLPTNAEERKNVFRKEEKSKNKSTVNKHAK